MNSFIFDVLNELQENNYNLSELTFVLPSKRAGLFLKHQILKVSKTTRFAPKILSIEEFVEELSQLKSAKNTDLLFEFYDTYLSLTEKTKQDSFESFSKWGQVLLQDFNEIDRYLISQQHIFDYLTAIKEINHWSSEKNQTDFIKNYLQFWNKLGAYYNHFTTSLINKNIGYQGLIYREAVENIESFIQNSSHKKIIFLGFNALNTAEATIIQELLHNDKAKIYWDIDDKFINNPKHDAGLFTRAYKNNWTFFKTHPFKWITQHYSEEKNISVFGIPKNVGQAKYIGELLEDLEQKNKSLERTAVVLGDENLLIPVLNSLPESIEATNITMGFPLKSIPLASLFEILFRIHKSDSKSFYYKEVISLLSNQFVKPLFFNADSDVANRLITHINRNNATYLNVELLKQIAPEHDIVLNMLFSGWDASVERALTNCTELIFAIKSYLDRDKASNRLSLEYLYRFNQLFNEISRLNSTYKHIKDISALHNIYIELLSLETLDFKGEPLEGLQIMGMLESRVLDFETVIISSVNEGILPAGKSNNSFIPFDVKLENKLPTYKEKDAVYTYHFYRLLQRAKNVIILYNTEADVLIGGEKSRFITQLELEGVHKIHHQIVVPKVPILEQKLKTIKKTEALLGDIYSVAQKGFSPSSLTSYIRNPIDFYYQKILKIREYDDVEETVAANTLGTVVHNTLEDFYKPLINQVLTVEVIKALKPRIEERVRFHFKKEFKEGDISKGKNLIVFEIAKRYVLNFINSEIEDIKNGNKVRILEIEAETAVDIDIPGIDFPVRIKGKVDRVDERNGVTRIIDYKTGNVQQAQVEIVDWENITTDYKKYGKSFQVLAYAYMMCIANKIQLPVEAGIVSFKNLKSGFLKFAKKESERSRTKDSRITNATILAFEGELQSLISEICNPKIDFTEKEV
ncbi:PD-(D/E)XK nuclease superfamily protein [Hyunsoonleella jejuensis]|uniref:PD-(D/E)XK nuclease superfamily protein n=1 Tax=Hyunsoonleella jejuensis TaxID=419940 RepID=A0A1H9BH26_9FLAO|nr:PD-(D/E)XK nuclease family protein [Hyunsoonleella jejuensis]SEP88292.1 PD-(D/E)XK nuclease superfamily protein [Hyunsoonleella jejuensis]